MAMGSRDKFRAGPQTTATTAMVRVWRILWLSMSAAMAQEGQAREWMVGRCMEWCLYTRRWQNYVKDRCIYILLLFNIPTCDISIYTYEIHMLYIYSKMRHAIICLKGVVCRLSSRLGLKMQPAHVERSCWATGPGSYLQWVSMWNGHVEGRWVWRLKNPAVN